MSQASRPDRRPLGPTLAHDPAAPLLASRRRVVQLAYAVDDVRVAARRWANAGAGPFFVVDHVPVGTATHRGRPARFDHSIALGVWGGQVLELVDVHVAEPEGLRQTALGRAGLHHVAWFADDLGEEGRRLAALGWPRVLEATAAGAAFAYHWNDEAGHLLEVYEPTGVIAALYSHLFRAAAGWDGAEPGPVSK